MPRPSHLDRSVRLSPHCAPDSIGAWFPFAHADISCRFQMNVIVARLVNRHEITELIVGMVSIYMMEMHSLLRSHFQSTVSA